MDIVNMRYGNWSVIASSDLGNQQEISES
jgi:hypothetical protein